jgi:anti-sigma regulatory factor (Ser/Thr protein kinase)
MKSNADNLPGNSKVKIEILSDPRMLKIVRAGVGHLCTIMGFPNVDKNSVVLAVDEACSNIIKHAYANAPDKIIKISCTIYEDRLEIRLRDFGERADLSKIEPRSLEDVRPGGLGVHLIRAVMNKVEYKNDAKRGNHLLLIKEKRKAE